jgi:D-alanyl-D-alanine carboxypeptidase
MPFRRASLASLVAIAAAAAVTVALVKATADRPSRDATFAPLLDDVVAAGAPGGLLVVDDEKPWSGARGLANRARRTPMRTDDRFRIGSITKTFVATVVLQLVAEGRLTLDAPVERWLPGLVPRGVTVRHLLSHTSGLFDYVNDPAAFTGKIAEPRKLVALAAAHPPLGKPGERFGYASTNYLALGLIVERVTGTSLEVQLTRRLFGPLRLTHTWLDTGAASRLRVHGYIAPTRDGIIVGPREDTTGRPAPFAWAAGAIVSDAHDVATFFAALLRGKLLPASLLREMIPRTGYGLGLVAYRTPCGTAYGHTGNLLGYISAAWNSPDGKRRIVLVANTYPLGGDAERAFHRALEVAYCG